MNTSEAIAQYVDMVKSARSVNTAETYQNGLGVFLDIVGDIPVQDLTEDAIIPLAAHLKGYAPATEQLYLQAAKGLYKFLTFEGIKAFNMERVKGLIEQRARRPGIRFPQFPAEDIRKLIDALPHLQGPDLAAARDRAFLYTLADTGLRVHEACKLRRGDIDWLEGRAVIIGKGNKQAVIRFTQRALDAIKAYLGVRAAMDGATGRPLATLPVFARHDKGTGKQVTAISTSTGRAIVHDRGTEVLGKHAITPHSFRHYFVSTILQSTGNLKLAQSLARHENIQATQRYAHISDQELDKMYLEVFENGSKEAQRS